jgi:hypothetical protein
LKLTIEKVCNGIIITDYDETENGLVEYKTIFEQKEEDSVKYMQDALFYINNTLGELENRYSQERISINIVHGDKYECEDKECPICKGDTL